MDVSESSFGVLLLELILESNDICGEEPEQIIIFLGHSLKQFHLPNELPPFLCMLPWSISTA